MIANLDENVARLDAILEESGMRDNTVFIFMTDNGGTGGYAKAYVNSPIGDTAAVRISAWYNDTPGWIAAHQPDGSVKSDVNDGTTKGVRAAMRFEAGGLIITPRVIYQKVETDGWNRQDAYNILGNPYTYGQELRLLTDEELGTDGGGYGNIPYGAVGVFVNGTYTTWRAA